MFIQSFNQGVVTNSSGASIMVLNKKLWKGDINYCKKPVNKFSDGDWCVLGENKAKRLFLFAMLSSCFREKYTYFENILHQDYYLSIAAEISHLTKKEKDKYLYGSWVDSESTWGLDLTHFPREFYNQLFTFYMRDDVFIYNGTRNKDDLGLQNKLSKLSGDDKKKLNLSYDPDTKIFSRSNKLVYMDEDELLIPVCELYDAGTVVLKQDGDFWVHFTYGDNVQPKITRFSFKRPEEVGLYKKSTVPEIVDLIITEKCEKNCEFCYRGCTCDGEHAKLDDIFYLERIFIDSKVFQVAIGGGEPTLHPDFSTILETMNQHGIMVNFTTYDTTWLDSSSIKDSVLRHVSGIGYSVHSLNDVESLELVRYTLNSRIDEIYQETRDDSTKAPVVVAHVVVNSMDFKEFVAILNRLYEECMPLLLLGFKKVGRGKDAPFFELDEDQKKWLAEFIKEKTESYYNISVDVAFTKAYRDIIDSVDVVENSLYAEEGKFTCCVNAVTNTIQPSSYSDEEYPFINGDYDNNPLDIYKKF